MSKKLSTIVGSGVASIGPLTVASGGTGATSAATALTTLGAQAALISGDNLKSINGTTLLGSGNLVVTGGLAATGIKTSSYTAAANDLVRCDTTAGAFSITFPASPADGVMIGIVDIANTFTTNIITVLPNTGKTIESDATSYLLDISGASVVFVYNSNTTNWRLMETPSAGSVAGGFSPTTPTYSYSALPEITTLSGTINPISVSYSNNYLSDNTSTASVSYSVAASEGLQTSFTFSATNINGLSLPNTPPLYTSLYFPNTKCISGTIALGVTQGKLTTVSFPELESSIGAALTITYPINNMFSSTPTSTTPSFPKLKIMGSISIINYVGSTLYLPPLLEDITGLLNYTNLINVTTITINYTKITGSISISNSKKLTSMSFPNLVSCSSIGAPACVDLTTFSAPNLTHGSINLNNTYSLATLNIPLLKFSPNIYVTIAKIAGALIFPELVYCGSMTVTNAEFMTSLEAPKLVYCGNFPSIANTGNTTFTYNFPLLAEIGTGGLSTGLNTNVTLPALTIIHGGGLTLYCNGTRTFTANLLEIINGTVALTSNFIAYDLPALKTINGIISFTSCASSVRLAFPSLVAVAELYYSSVVAINITTCTAFTTFVFPTTLKRVGNIYCKNVIITGCALTQVSVDSILVQLAALDGTNGTTLYSGATISLGGGTSATPSATGLTAKATLVARGCTVTHN